MPPQLFKVWVESNDMKLHEKTMLKGLKVVKDNSLLGILARPVLASLH
jgi:hypothetical protein